MAPSQSWGGPKTNQSATVTPTSTLATPAMRRNSGLMCPGSPVALQLTIDKAANSDRSAQGQCRRPRSLRARSRSRPAAPGSRERSPGRCPLGGLNGDRPHQSLAELSGVGQGPRARASAGVGCPSSVRATADMGRPGQSCTRCRPKSDGTRQPGRSNSVCEVPCVTTERVIRYSVRWCDM